MFPSTFVISGAVAAPLDVTAVLAPMALAILAVGIFAGGITLLRAMLAAHATPARRGVRIAPRSPHPLPPSPAPHAV